MYQIKLTYKTASGESVCRYLISDTTARNAAEALAAAIGYAIEDYSVNITSAVVESVPQSSGRETAQ